MQTDEELTYRWDNNTDLLKNIPQEDKVYYAKCYELSMRFLLKLPISYEYDIYYIIYLYLLSQEFYL